MLVNLKVNNIALIEKLNVDFNKGLTVLTGETGAGKSIIIDAINFVLGERADKSLIRTGQTFAKVDAVFCFDDLNKNVVNIFNELGIEFDGTAILSRTMSFEGKNECRVNGQIVTVGMLKQISTTLIDIHGQQEHQVVMNPKHHIDILDTFTGADLVNIKSELLNKLNQLKQINKSINSIGGSETERQQQIDFLQFQLNELKKANLVEGEEAELIEQLKILNSAEKIKCALNETILMLDANSVNALGCLNYGENKLSSISSYKQQYDALHQRLNSIRLDLQDCVEELKVEQSILDFDQNEYDRIDSRLDLIRNLKRKFNKTESELIAYVSYLEQQLSMLVSSEQLLSKLNSDKSKVIDELKVIANSLTNKRKQFAIEFEKEIKNQLVQLGMPSAVFKIDFKENELEFEKTLTTNGVDNIEFMFSANLGQPLKPLIKVISGGEMSRFMLAFKTVISNTDNINTLIFDEIDTGISGNIAHVVAQKMAGISKFRQVICISHLPQISAMADNHFLISKFETDTDTKTKLQLLDNNERISEISRLLGVIANSESGKASAKELLNQSQIYKNKL